MMTTLPASAQSYSYGPNLGSLSYTFTQTVQTCQLPNHGGNRNYYYYSFSNFVYNANNGTNPVLSGSTYYIADAYGGNGNCPLTGPGPTVWTGGTGFTISITPLGYNSIRSTITVPGYINPKFIVVGIVYAPPGKNSFVQYSNSKLVSSTVTTKTGFYTGYTQSNTQLYSLTIKPFKGGQLDGSAQDSTTYSNSTTSTDSTGVTIQQTIGNLRTYPGPACDYCGVDHDYDQILVWLNPVVLYTLTNNGVVYSQGYGYSTWDQPAIDVYPVYVCELNGDCQMRSTTTNAFARSWASALTWPAGQGPALTTQDEQNILKMDPYWNCTYQSPVSDTTDCAEPPDSTRYTESTNQNISYAQPVPGAQPNTTQYTESYTNTDTNGLDVTVENDQTVSYENVFGVSIFGIGFKDTINNSTTMKWTYETSSQFTSSSTSTAESSITQPACNDVNGSCNPVYPPPNAYNPFTCTALQLPTAFGQGYNMILYQDNLFGTFLYEPYGQP